MIDDVLKDANTEHMEVHLRPEQEAFIEASIRTGRFASADEAVREAVGLLERTERTRVEEEEPVAPAWTHAGTLVRSGLSGHDLVEVVQACPFPEVDLEPSRTVMPVRDAAF